MNGFEDLSKNLVFRLTKWTARKMQPLDSASEGEKQHIVCRIPPPQMLSNKNISYQEEIHYIN